MVSPGAGTSQTLAGSFWAFGGGSPLNGIGRDNGALPVTSWLLTDGSNLHLSGDWSTTGVDGCITGRVAPGKPAEIMVVAVSDEGSTGGFFAVAAARRFGGAYPEYDFTFAAGGGASSDIHLVDIPRPSIVSFTPPGSWLLAGPTLSEVSAGVYTDGTAVASELVKGYRLYVYSQSQPPTSHRVSAGWSAVSPVMPLGQDVGVTITGGGDKYLAYGLAFESNFETEHVGRYLHLSTGCHVTDQDGDGFSDILGDPACCPEPSACDCNDADPAVHPGALEVCNGLDDDCDGSVDNVDLPGAVSSVALSKAPSATRLSWPALPVATTYDVVRGDLTELLNSRGSFSAATRACLADALTAPSVDAPGDPDPGYGFWYLVRAANCTGVGSYDTPDLVQVVPRDPGIAASGQACP